VKVQKYVDALERENSDLQAKIGELEAKNFSAGERIKVLQKRKNEHNEVFISLRLTGVMHPTASEALQEDKEAIYGPWRYKRLVPETPNRPSKVKKTPKHERRPRASSR